MHDHVIPCGPERNPFLLFACPILPSFPSTPSTTPQMPSRQITPPGTKIRHVASRESRKDQIIPRDHLSKTHLPQIMSIYFILPFRPFKPTNNRTTIPHNKHPTTNIQHPNTKYLKVHNQTEPFIQDQPKYKKKNIRYVLKKTTRWIEVTTSAASQTVCPRLLSQPLIISRPLGCSKNSQLIQGGGFYQS